MHMRLVQRLINALLASITCATSGDRFDDRRQDLTVGRLSKAG